MAQLDELAQILNRRREELGLSMRAVAKAAGISNVYLWVLERGQNPRTGKPSRPSVDVLLALARELALDEGQLLELAGYPRLVAITSSGTSRSLDARSLETLVRRLEALEAGGASVDRQWSLGLRPGDHLLLFAGEGSEAYGEALRATIRTSLSDPLRRDACVVRLEPGHSAQAMRSEVGPVDGERLLLVEAEEAWEPYKPGSASPAIIETVDSDEEAHRRDAERIREARPDAVHVLTEDCSAFAASIANPDMLFTEVEPRWLATEQAIYGDLPVSIVCLYKEADIRSMPASHISYAERLLHLAGSHNRLAVVKDDILLTGGAAAAELLTEVVKQGVDERLAPRVVETAIAHHAPAGEWLRPYLRLAS